MMIDPEVYRQSYGLHPETLLPGAPPVFRMRGVFRSDVFWSTAPYLTDEIALPSDEVRQNLYAHALREQVHRSRAQYGLIKTRDLAWAQRMAQGGAQVVDRFVTSVVDLTVSEEALWSQTLHRKRRAQVERARAVDAEFRIERESGLDAFYSVFVETQTRLGTPAHGRVFFRWILRTDPQARLITAYVAGRPVSTALLLQKAGTLFHPFTGTLAEFFPTYLNARLYWEIMRYGMAQGLERFDLGRSFKGSGVHEFKKYWGSRDVPLAYVYLTERSKVPSLETPLLKAATQAWSHLPIGVARWLGPHLIRGVP